MTTERSHRVLILAKEQVLHWVPLYVAAFRECADVITVGPPLNVEVLAAHDWQHTKVWLDPVNIESAADTLEEILGLLPPGWLPELIVTIQSAGPVIRDIARSQCPTVYISVDSWHDHEEFRYARPYDHVFVAQRAMVPYFHEAGIPHAHWLPLACSPRHHHSVGQEVLHDVVFAGMTMYMVNRERMARLLRLEKHFEVGVFGAIGGDDYCRALESGTVVFNSSVAQDLNMRVFEAMAIGRPLLTNRDARANGLDDLFVEGEHFVGYDDTDLVEQARALLNDEARREQMASRAREEVLTRHTYRHRVEAVIAKTLDATVTKPVENILRSSARLSAWLPRGCRIVVDVGLQLDRSKVALRRLGVERLIGVSLDTSDARSKSYDEVCAWSAGDLRPDTIVCAHNLDARLPLPDLFGFGRRVLPAGGELLLILNDAEAEISGLGKSPDDWETWSYGEQFHLILCHSLPEGGLVLRFRRYERALEIISAEIFERFPGGGNHPEVGVE